MAKGERQRLPGGLVLAPVLCVGFSAFIGIWLATQHVANFFDYQEQLGQWWFQIGENKIYPPLSYFIWLRDYNPYGPEAFNSGLFILAGAVAVGIVFALLVSLWQARLSAEVTTYGSARWAKRHELKKSGLLDGEGVVLGTTEDRHYLTHNGPEHIEVTAPSRSGKGVGIVVPTLLSWKHSVIVNDIKGENWNTTAAYRSRFSYVLKFNPAFADTCRFNPLFEVRRGEYEVRDVQNLCDMIVDPDGKGKPDHWSKEADSWLLAVILHVLYAEPNKTLGGIARFLNDPDHSIDQLLQMMLRTRHTQEGVRPVVAIGVRAMLNKSDNERSGVHSTARSFFSLYLDPLVAAATSDSDFRIANLMQAEHPLSLYLISPPSDKSRLRPLFRLMLNQMCKRLTESLDNPNNNWRLLLLIDEFPSLGKLEFFEEGLAYVAGYGIKCMMINQSVNQIRKYYGTTNTVMDSCHIHVFYAPNTDETAEMISKTLGTKTEIHQQKNYAGHRLSPWLGHTMVSDQQTSRPLLTPGEVRELPASDEIVIVAGLPPIYAKKIRYFEDSNFKSLIGEQPKGTEQRPYPFGPARVAHPWTCTPQSAALFSPAAEVINGHGIKITEPEIMTSKNADNDISNEAIVVSPGALVEPDLDEQAPSPEQSLQTLTHELDRGWLI